MINLTDSEKDILSRLWDLQHNGRYGFFLRAESDDDPKKPRQCYALREMFEDHVIEDDLSGGLEWKRTREEQTDGLFNQPPYLWLSLHTMRGGWIEGNSGRLSPEEAAVALDCRWSRLVRDIEIVKRLEAEKIHIVFGMVPRFILRAEMGEKFDSGSENALQHLEDTGLTRRIQSQGITNKGKDIRCCLFTTADGQVVLFEQPEDSMGFRITLQGIECLSGQEAMPANVEHDAPSVPQSVGTTDYVNDWTRFTEAFRRYQRSADPKKKPGQLIADFLKSIDLGKQGSTLKEGYDLLTQEQIKRLKQSLRQQFYKKRLQ